MTFFRQSVLSIACQLPLAASLSCLTCPFLSTGGQIGGERVDSSFRALLLKLEQICISFGHRRHLYFHKPSLLIASHHNRLVASCVQPFFRHPEKADLLQCCDREFPLAHRAWAAALADDGASGLHFTLLQELLKQLGYCIMEFVVADVLLPARIVLKNLAPLHADKD